MSLPARKSILLPVAVTVTGVLLSWHVLVLVTGVPKFIFPAPLAVLQTLISHYQVLLSNALVTSIEIVCGLLIGTVLGIASAMLLTCLLYTSPSPRDS